MTQEGKRPKSASQKCVPGQSSSPGQAPETPWLTWRLSHAFLTPCLPSPSGQGWPFKPRGSQQVSENWGQVTDPLHRKICKSTSCNKFSLWFQASSGPDYEPLLLSPAQISAAHAARGWGGGCLAAQTSSGSPSSFCWGLFHPKCLKRFKHHVHGLLPFLLPGRKETRLSFLFYFWQLHVACWILVPQQGFNPSLPLEAPNVNHWTTREVPSRLLFLIKAIMLQGLVSGGPVTSELDPWQAGMSQRSDV